MANSYIEDPELCFHTSTNDEAFIVTNPDHGGKVDCHKCGAWIYENESWLRFDWAYFHVACFNRYEHYYGLDKPID